jgi:hypothetical protein
MAICWRGEWKSQPIINITRLLSSEPCSITFSKSTLSRGADEVIQSINMLPMPRPTVFDSDLSNLSVRERPEKSQVSPGQRLRLLAYPVRDQEVEGLTPFAPTTFCFPKDYRLRFRGWLNAADFFQPTR